MERKKFFAKNSRSKADRIKMKRRLVDALGGKCVDCGYSAHLAALDFDHIDPKTKEYTIASRLVYLDYLQLLEEAKKCVLRCANCHRIRTHPDYTETNDEHVSKWV